MTRESALRRRCDQGNSRDAVERKSGGVRVPMPSIGPMKVHRRIGLVCLIVPLLMLFAANQANAQILDDLEFAGGYTHITGDQGLDGFNLSTAWWMNRRVAIAFNYDSGWDTSTLGNFDLTSVGQVAFKSHIQNFLIGPRVFFSEKHINKYRLSPFAEAQIGATHLSQKIQQVNTGTISASANSFSWMLGGGADYRFTGHWSGRLNLDFLRTHLANNGQSRLRIGLGVAYTFGTRGAKF